MKTETEIRMQLTHYECSLEGWKEPSGYLVPSEPDPDERRRVREGLNTAIYVLKWVLGEDPRA